MREEVDELKGQLQHARKDNKYLRERMEQLAAENRVLRRDPKKGKRDAVIEQLEVELQRKEQARARERCGASCVCDAMGWNSIGWNEMG